MKRSEDNTENDKRSFSNPLLAPITPPESSSDSPQTTQSNSSSPRENDGILKDGILEEVNLNIANSDDHPKVESFDSNLFNSLKRIEPTEPPPSPYTTSKIAFFIAGFITSAGPALNALAMPKSANTIFDTWGDFSTAWKIFSILNCTASMYVNTVLNTAFYENAYERTKSITSNLKDAQNLFDKVITSSIFGAAIIFGLYGAMGLAGLTWETFEAILMLNIFMTSLTTLSTIVSRFLGTAGCLEMVRNYCEGLTQLKTELVHHLKHLNPEYRDEFQHILDQLTGHLYESLDKTLDIKIQRKNFYTGLIPSIVEELEKLEKSKEDPKFFLPSTYTEQTANFLYSSLSLSFASITAGASFIVFTQKTIKGLDVVTGNTHKIEELMEKLPPELKSMPGWIGGLATAFLGAYSAVQIPKALTQAMSYAKENKKQIPFLTLDLTANTLSASSLLGVGLNFLNSPNAFNIPNNDPLDKFFGTALGLYVWFVNGLSVLRRYEEQPSIAARIELPKLGQAIETLAFDRKTYQAVRLFKTRQPHREVDIEQQHLIPKSPGQS